MGSPPTTAQLHGKSLVGVEGAEEGNDIFEQVAPDTVQGSLFTKALALGSLVSGARDMFKVCSIIICAI